MSRPRYPIHTLWELATETRKRYPDAVAFEYTDRNKQDHTITFNTFYTEVNRLRRQYASMYHNERIAILGENSLDWIVHFFAITCSGNTVIPLDRLLNKEDILNIIKSADCPTLVCSSSYSDYAEWLASRVPGLSILPVTQRYLPSAVVSDSDITPDRNDIAAIVFTSGTTSAPKGVMLTHGNICADVYAGADSITLHGSTMLLLPLNHMFTLTANLLSPFYHGVRNAICARPNRITENFLHYKPSLAFLVPAQLYYLQSSLSRNDADQIRNALGGNLDIIISGGSTLKGETVRFFNQQRVTLLNGYGITECSPIVSLNQEDANKPGSVGLPLNGVSVRIAHPVDGVGEIQVRGDTVMAGYLNDPQQTTKAFEDGYFRTGDLGYLDEDGFLFITGRSKNVIILENGKNVYPEELESQLLNYPCIQEVLVFESNDHIAAEIYPATSTENATHCVQEAIHDFNTKQPNYKNIGEIILRESPFPKTASNKIIRERR